MNSDQFQRCTWPPLSAPFDAALRDAVRFVFGETKPSGIIATGTIVRAQAHANSDLDIYVIHGEAFRRRVQQFFHGVPTEIFINPPQAVRQYFVDEHRDGRLFTAHMLATGTVVYAAAPLIDELRTEAGQWLRRRTNLPDAEITHARYTIATRVEDGADVTESDAHTAAMLLSDAVRQMIEFFCRTRLGRVPRTKEMFATAAAEDSEVGRLTTAFYDAPSPEERLRIAQSLSDRIVGAHGFFVWDSGPEPVPGSGPDRPGRSTA